MWLSITIGDDSKLSPIIQYLARKGIDKIYATLGISREDEHLAIIVEERYR